MESIPHFQISKLTNSQIDPQLKSRPGSTERLLGNEVFILIKVFLERCHQELLLV